MINLKTLCVILGIMAFVAIMRIVWIHGYDTAMSELQYEYSDSIHHLNVALQDACDQLRYHVGDDNYSLD